MHFVMYVLYLKVQDQGACENSDHDCRIEVAIIPVLMIDICASAAAPMAWALLQYCTYS